MKTEKPDPRRSAYDKWYADQIQLGLDDLDSGRVVTHEEFLKHSEELMRKLERKHAKAA